MIKLYDVEISKSIETGWLIRKHTWYDIIDKIAFAIILILLIVCSLLIFLQINFNDPKDRISFLAILLPVVFLFAFYGLYRIFFGKRLTIFETSFGQSKNHELLYSFLKDFQYKNFQDSEDIIIANEENEFSFNLGSSKTIVFIISERKIYFNIVNKYPIISPPVLFAHLILKHDLKKYFFKNQ